MPSWQALSEEEGAEGLRLESIDNCLIAVANLNIMFDALAQSDSDNVPAHIFVSCN
jgi:hypothetical protein